MANKAKNSQNTSSSCTPRTAVNGSVTVLPGGKADTKVEWIDYADAKGVRLERRIGGTRPWRTNNPGNLRQNKKGPLDKFGRNHDAIGIDSGRFYIFPDVETGERARETLLKNDKYQALPLAKAIERYAPKKDGNNPEKYLKFITDHTDFTAKTLLSSLTEKQYAALLDAMHAFEGAAQGEAAGYKGEGEIVGYTADGTKIETITDRRRTWLLERPVKKLTKDEMQELANDPAMLNDTHPEAEHLCKKLSECDAWLAALAKKPKSKRGKPLLKRIKKAPSGGGSPYCGLPRGHGGMVYVRAYVRHLNGKAVAVSAYWRRAPGAL
ncbi:MAG: hypothetical protein PHE83_08295 [Opitutaceae bacterium]|nr:hypothetical protein [Opitutaceae bacterium]